MLPLWLSAKQPLTISPKVLPSASRWRTSTRPYGYYKENLISQTFKGMEGKAKIDALMESFRANTPKSVGPFKVLAMEDYRSSIRTDIATGETSELTLPKSNVLYFELDDKAWVCSASVRNRA